MNKKQRRTLKRIFEKPERSDISWLDIESIFTALGADISEGRGSRVRVALKEVRAVFHRPHPNRITNKGADPFALLVLALCIYGITLLSRLHNGAIHLIQIVVGPPFWRLSFLKKNVHLQSIYPQ